MTDINTIPKQFKEYFTKYSDNIAQLSKNKNGEFQPTTVGELYKLVRTFGAGLLSLEIKRQDHVGIISDNRKEWLVSNLAILCIGAADVPRGSDITTGDLQYILHHADCTICIAENSSQLNKLLSIKKSLPLLKTIIIIDNDFKQSASMPINKGVKILSFNDILKNGRAFLKQNPTCFEDEIDKGKAEETATIIYTSGTTGEPKGVMLSHNNFMHQISAPHALIYIQHGDVFFSVLPIWHSFERSVEYFALLGGCAIAYSKPIGKIMIEDMSKVKPMIFPSVPRIWAGIRTAIYKNVKSEGGIKMALFNFFVSIGTAHSKLFTMFRGLLPQFKRRFHFLDMLISFIPLLLLTPFQLLGQVLVFSKIKKKLGGRFRFGISGAGALPPHVDNFFAAAGILLLEGYGLTEAAPIVSVRNCKAPVPGTIGPPLPEIDVKIKDKAGNTLSAGQKGILHIKGPNIMTGYYKKPKITAQTISEDGWLNTGDLAILTHKGEIKIIGRVKETIVLLGGENIEPDPIENTILQSEYIDQVMVVGQDKNHLSALVVPNFDSLEQFAKNTGIPFVTVENLTGNIDIQKLIMDEINIRVNYKKGFLLFERIYNIKLLSKPFEAGKELTPTLKLKRDVINKIYKKEIADLFNKQR